MTDESTFEPELAEIEAMLRQLEPSDLALDAPPADIWNQIVAELGDELDTAATAHTTLGTVVEAPFGRRRTWMAPLLAAAAAIVVVIAGVTIVNSGSSTTTSTGDSRCSRAPTRTDDRPARGVHIIRNGSVLTAAEGHGGTGARTTFAGRPASSRTSRGTR